TDALVMPTVAAPQDIADPPCAPVWTKTPGPRISRRAISEDIRAGGPGAVLIAMEIGPDGVPVDARALATAPAGRTAFEAAAEAAAIEAAWKWRADPATLEGCEGVKYVTPFIFVLN